MGEITLVLIEANETVTETLSVSLAKDFQLFSASNSQSGLTIIDRLSPEIIIVDLNLPDNSGLSILTKIRQIGVKAPILVLGNDSSLKTKLAIFAAGADDYLLKPFSLGELKARLSVNVRHLQSTRTTASTLKTPNLILDKINHCVSREGGRAIDLRRKEYAILEYLIINAGQTVSRTHLASYAWSNSREPWSNAVDVHIKHLRDKIDKPYTKRLITTIHGYGYRLEVND